MLVVALKYGLAQYATMMVACMSVAEIYQEHQVAKPEEAPVEAKDEEHPYLVT